MLSVERISDAFPPTFSFDGLVDENGRAGILAKFSPPKNVPMPPEEIEGKEFDLRKANLEYWSAARAKDCGRRSAEVSIFTSTSGIAKALGFRAPGPDGKEFIDYLTNFGGISIFRDEINVFPAEWGAETDWLSLSKRHIKQGFRMSYYNMIGNLEINQATNIELIDKTNREGLIANRASKDLTQLVHAIIAGVIETQIHRKARRIRRADRRHGARPQGVDELCQARRGGDKGNKGPLSGRRRSLRNSGSHRQTRRAR